MRRRWRPARSRRAANDRRIHSPPAGTGNECGRNAMRPRSGQQNDRSSRKEAPPPCFLVPSRPFSNRSPVAASFPARSSSDRRPGGRRCPQQRLAGVQASPKSPRAVPNPAPAARSPLETVFQTAFNLTASASCDNPLIFGCVADLPRPYGEPPMCLHAQGIGTGLRRCRRHYRATRANAPSLFARLSTPDPSTSERLCGRPCLLLRSFFEEMEGKPPAPRCAMVRKNL